MADRFSQFGGYTLTSTFVLTSTAAATIAPATTGIKWVPVSAHITTSTTAAVLVKDTTGVGLLSPSNAGLQLEKGIVLPHNPNGIGKPGTTGDAVTIQSDNGSATVSGLITFMGVNMAQPSA